MLRRTIPDLGSLKHSIRVVSLLTTQVVNKALGQYLSEQTGASGNLLLTSATLEVLACIAFKQPICQAEIDRLFDADKRGLVVKLRGSETRGRIYR